MQCEWELRYCPKPGKLKKGSCMRGAGPIARSRGMINGIGGPCQSSLTQYGFPPILNGWDGSLTQGTGGRAKTHSTLGGLSWLATNHFKVLLVYKWTLLHLEPLFLLINAYIVHKECDYISMWDYTELTVSRQSNPVLLKAPLFSIYGQSVEGKVF